MTGLIGLVTTTAAGRAAAAELARVLPATAAYDVREISTAWRDCGALVVFLATGATVRLLAPLLQDKTIDPGVVCVDEARRFAVSLVGGHGGGANSLAEQVAEALGAQAIVTTATDAVDLPGLDTLGWPIEGAVAAVGRALLDGERVRLDADAAWPLPPLLVGETGEHVLAVTDRLLALDPLTAVLRPPSLVLGIGASRGVTADELEDLADRSLADHGLSAHSVAFVATVDAKAEEPGLLELCTRRGWPLVTHPADALATVEVPNPSVHPQAALGTPSVAEAAATLHGERRPEDQERDGHHRGLAARPARTPCPRRPRPRCPGPADPAGP